MGHILWSKQLRAFQNSLLDTVCVCVFPLVLVYTTIVVVIVVVVITNSQSLYSAYIVV